MSEAYLLKEHREWIGLLQPVGLVVSPTALARAQLRLQKDVFELQNELISITDDAGILPMHLPNLFIRVLGWRKEDLFTGDSIDDLQVYLPERETLLKADFAVKNVDTQNFEILIKDIGQKNFDEDEMPEGRGWQTTPHAKFERHLREKNISIGILVGQTGLRLVYAPKGETSGYLTFPFAFMRETQGRPVLSAMHLLLSEDRIFKGDPSQRLPALLIESRKFQNDVSTQLSEQVLAALYELLRGLQEADEASGGQLLKEVLVRDKNEVYHGLLTVLLRIVFLLYAEDRDLLSSDPVFLNNYSINGLFARLREDFSKHHDSLNFRFGAWAHLLSLFRLVYEGAELETDAIPGRKGHLFEPEAFPFLEGWTSDSGINSVTRVSDGVVWRVLSNLMTLDGERISYRALDVEQIGSVYETVMGFQLQIAEGSSVAISSDRPRGAPVVVNLDELLSIDRSKRAARVKELSEVKLDAKTIEAIKVANGVEELAAAFGKRLAYWATPVIVKAGKMIFQPSDERRRSGSHYTPRSLTGPIVSKAIEPILLKLGPDPRPHQILELKVCDPAMGSGAFLVEACRQLSELLVKSWAIYQPEVRNEIPADEDELLYARRMIAQRCLYGVDKNPMAVNLAKLSLWLATFAKSHEFTFLDHCLKCGDSLVGLEREQIWGVTWEFNAIPSLLHASIADRLKRARDLRNSISNSPDGTPVEKLEILKQQEDELLNDLRGVGDAVVYSYFSKQKPRARKDELERIRLLIEAWFASGVSFAQFKGLENELNWMKKTEGLLPFHWEIEFPEVFSANESEELGFDAIIGNPPFLGGSRIGSSLGSNYRDLIYMMFPGAGNRMDLVGYFFRRSFRLLRSDGALGLISTNTISQGDTRQGTFPDIIAGGGQIFSVTERLKWPGEAAVIVSIVHILKGECFVPRRLNNRIVPVITPFFLGSGAYYEPVRLTENQDIAGIGAKIYGQGFLFADNDEECTPLAEMKRILEAKPNYQEVIRPYLIGDDINFFPDHRASRYAIDFGNMTKAEANQFPELLSIVENKVAVSRKRAPKEVQSIPWWHYSRTREKLFSRVRARPSVLAISQTSKFLAFAKVPSNQTFDQKVVIFDLDPDFAFPILQSRVHESWMNLMGSSMKDDPVYTPSDCFDTFPLPANYLANDELRLIGESYYSYRSNLLQERHIGLTSLYNLFHDPSCSDGEILRLRSLHLEMDQRVLEAYGWSDLEVSTVFESIYGEPEDSYSIRLRWVENLNDVVLGRLLEENARRPSRGGMFDDDTAE